MDSLPYLQQQNPDNDMGKLCFWEFNLYAVILKKIDEFYQVIWYNTNRFLYNNGKIYK